MQNNSMQQEKPSDAILAMLDRGSDNGGVCSHSSTSAYESYAIFCVGHSPLRQAAFRSWALEHKIGFKSLIGKYKGMMEMSFIVNVHDLEECYVWYAREETILILGPATRNGIHYGNRPASLRYPDRHEEDLGLWQWTTRKYALTLDSWTYDPSDGTYYICEH